MIDHHLNPQDFPTIVVSETSASSTSQLIVELIEQSRHSELLDEKYQCICRFFILASYMLAGDAGKAEEEFVEFLEYYRNLAEDFKIIEERWVFRGLSKAIHESGINRQSRMELLNLIDLIQGTLDRRHLSLFG